jgi:hypothetical protein
MEHLRTRVFVSYSHRDDKLRIALDKHLTMLKRGRRIEEWHDRRIDPGTEFEGEIDAHLNEAQLVLLLVSPDFLASEYCYSKEMERAMQMHESGVTRVVPVILRPVDWKDAPFAKLLALPTDGKPVTKWSNRDSAFLDIAEGIKRILAEFDKRGGRRQQAGSDWLRDLRGFAGSVLHIGGVGSRFVTKTAWLLDEHGYLPANEYITHYFNGPADVMWVNCPDAFRIVNASSPTGNSVFPMVEGDEDTAYGIHLLDQLQNKILIVCEAKPMATASPTGDVADV